MYGLSNGERISRLHISKTSVSTPSSVSCIDWLMALFVECASLDVRPFWPPRCICVCVCVWQIKGHWGLTDGHLSALFAFTPKVRGGHKKSKSNKFNPDRAKVTHSVTPTTPNQYAPHTILFLIFWARLFPSKQASHTTMCRPKGVTNIPWNTLFYFQSYAICFMSNVLWRLFTILFWF